MPNDDNSPVDGYEYWESHPEAPIEDWRYEVANNDTRNGYWNWVKHVLGIIES